MAYTISTKEYEALQEQQFQMIVLQEQNKQLMLENIALQAEAENLALEVLSLADRIKIIVEKVLPICYEIDATKGIFKVFIIAKLAVKVVDLIIKEFKQDK